MPAYYFLLGNTPQLSLAELETSFPKASFMEVVPNLIKTDSLPKNFEPTKAINILGGTVKIIQELPGVEATTQSISEYLQSLDSKPVFSLSHLGFDEEPQFSAQDIKKVLKQSGNASRYLDSPQTGLSASVLLHKEGVEDIFVIKNSDVKSNNGEVVAKTVAIQNIDDWTVRDRQKPYFDRASGMLPPKVARMMVNIGLSAYENEHTKPATNLYDPFCGSGTVLMESPLVELDLIGSDQNPEAVTGTRLNLAWFQDTFEVQAKSINIFNSDATNKQIVEKLPQKVDLIVTEPFLGKPKPKPNQLDNIFKGLEKLYKGTLKNWARILKPSGIVVVVLPSSDTSTSAHNMSDLIDDLDSLGYNIVLGPIEYARPQAVIKRQIYVLKFGK